MPLRLVNDTDGSFPAEQPAQGLALDMLVGSLRHGRTALLAPLSLRIHQAETVVLLSRYGLARAALMRAAAGLHQNMRGKVRMPLGVGAVLPEPAMPRGGTPIETVMKCAPLDPIAAYHGLEEVGLGRHADINTDELSDTAQRRLHLACAVAGNPGLLVVDGLFDGLEGSDLDEVRSAFVAVRAGRQLAVLLSGVESERLEPLASRVVTLDGLPATITSDLSHHPTPFEAALRG